MRKTHSNMRPSHLRAFNVFLPVVREDKFFTVGYDLLDTVFYAKSDNITADEVKRALVNHDGYDSTIIVKEEY